ncbi:helix-turn-helix domain-containing protein [Dysgonomonas massiliensis]|uniref:helix-turn-helix domain-containing protein n=1 Tax=Dysgonomonas massiliensis TaxID=2040292 RepID=UPI000C7839B0|nr:helix-turn-helix domain-containing protein [Dysgonomonas massiliensis]
MHTFSTTKHIKEHIFNKLFFVISICFFLAGNTTALFAQKEPDIKRILDSVEKNKGIKKLEVLTEYINNYPNQVVLINKLETEAKKQSEHLYLACTYKYKARLHSRRTNDNDSTEFYIDLISDELIHFEKEAKGSLKKETKELYYSIKKDLIARKVSLYLSKNQYILAQNTIREILEEGKIGDIEPFQSQIYYLLGMTYLITGNAEAALENLYIAEYFLEQSIQEESQPFPYYDISEGIINANQELKRFDEAIELSNKLLDRINKDFNEKFKENQENQYIYNLLRLRMNCTASFLYTKVKNKEKAREYLAEAQKLINEFPESSIYTELFYQCQAEYYLLIEDYKKARQNISVLTDKYNADESLHNSSNYIRVHLTLANILNAEGSKDEAYKLLSDLYLANDSINNAKLASEMLQMQVQYNVDKMKREAQENKVKLNNLYLMVLTLVIVAIALIGMLYFKRKNEQLLKQKNRQLYNKYLEIEKYSKKILELESEQRKLTVEDSCPANGNDPMDIIMDRLDSYLWESGDYKNPSIKREEVALQIGTNRQYLIDAIKTKRGKTFNEYINTFRIKYAYDIIIAERDKPISEIYLEAGFLTKGTFNRAFKMAYEMTPSELRNAIK